MFEKAIMNKRWQPFRATSLSALVVFANMNSLQPGDIIITADGGSIRYHDHIPFTVRFMAYIDQAHLTRDVIASDF